MVFSYKVNYCSPKKFLGHYYVLLSTECFSFLSCLWTWQLVRFYTYLNLSYWLIVHLCLMITSVGLGQEKVRKQWCTAMLVGSIATWAIQHLPLQCVDRYTVYLPLVSLFGSSAGRYFWTSQGADNKEYSSMLRKALEGAVMLHTFPKTTVDVFALVLESGGSMILS